ncbi:hypothetical protein [Methanofollis fontis]|nr:hypothetical protein [Methanofollis fontis]
MKNDTGGPRDGEQDGGTGPVPALSAYLIGALEDVKQRKQAKE